MNSTFEPDAPAEEKKDLTKWIWLGIGVAFLLMVIALWQFGGVKHTRSVVRVKHILIAYSGSDPSERARAHKLAKEIKEEIDSGGDFAKLARKYSNDPGSAARGGDLGYAEKGAYVDAFEDYVWSAPIGEVSDIIQTQHGFHIVVVVDRIISEIDKAKKEQERLIEERSRRLTGGESDEESSDSDENDAADQ